MRARLEGDATFLTRLERFFTELRDPLVSLYGEDPRFPEQCAAMAATARARDPELRRLDHEREITPDWLQREQRCAPGSDSTIAAPPSGSCSGVAD